MYYRLYTFRGVEQIHSLRFPQLEAALKAAVAFMSPKDATNEACLPWIADVSNDGTIYEMELTRDAKDWWDNFFNPEDLTAMQIMRDDIAFRCERERREAGGLVLPVTDMTPEGTPESHVKPTRDNARRASGVVTPATG